MARKSSLGSLGLFGVLIAILVAVPILMKIFSRKEESFVIMTSCSSTANCKSSEFCSRSKFAKSGLCTTKKTSGQPCDDASQCYSGLCRKGKC